MGKWATFIATEAVHMSHHTLEQVSAVTIRAYTLGLQKSRARNSGDFSSGIFG